MLNKIKTIPYHLFLIAVLPVISLYVHNMEQLNFRSTLRAYVVFLFGAIIIFVAFFLIVRKAHVAALVVSYALILFYAIIPFQSLLVGNHLKNISRMRYLLPVFAFVFVMGIWIGVKKIRNPKRITQVFNLMALSTLMLPFFQIGTYVINVMPRSDQGDKSLIEVESPLSPPGNEQVLPDMYYILLDTHGRPDVLQSEFGYDSSSFLMQLSELGFYVAPSSNANYPSSTWESMYATLNMQYLDNENIRTRNPVAVLSEGYEGIQSNKVFSNFKALGYRLVSFSNTYEFLNFYDADVFYDFHYFPGTQINLINPFEKMLLSEIIIGDLININHSWNKVYYENTKSSLETIAQVPSKVGSPKFVYLHLTVPHFPYVFSPEGDFVDDAGTECSVQGYIGQLTWIDSQMPKIVKRIIDHSSNPPIIIIQGDHGFHCGDVKNSIGVLNAYYLPGINVNQVLYPSISPVNSFRLIFNLYFDGKYTMLEDSVFLDKNVKMHTDISDSAYYDFIPYAVLGDDGESK